MHSSSQLPVRDEARVLCLVMSMNGSRVRCEERRVQEGRYGNGDVLV